jgi:hypothetical protein
MVVCTLASAGRKLPIANPVGGGGAGAWAWAAVELKKTPLYMNRVNSESFDDRGDGNILSPDDNGEG